MDDRNPESTSTSEEFLAEVLATKEPGVVAATAALESAEKYYFQSVASSAGPPVRVVVQSHSVSN